MKQWLAEMQACKDMADVCELAHKRTVNECKQLGVEVDCPQPLPCSNIEHDNNEDTHYSTKAQEIFDQYYDEITSFTGL